MPAISLGEIFMKPTTMLYRNLLALETEELARANPVDGLILLGGCDKTVPGLLMGAITMDIPTIFVAAGPQLRGNYHGEVLGSGTDVWKYWAERRAGKIDRETWEELEDGFARSFGTCMTMGTASTMAAAVEAMGMSLPGSSSIPAADSQHARAASLAGRRIVEMVWEDLRPSAILDERAFDNSVTVAMAMGGSTNAIVHLIALAKRAGVGLDLARFDKLSRRTPVIANIRPSGAFLMEDFYYAGGLRAMMHELRELLELSARTVTGETIGETIAGAEVYNPEVILPLDRALSREGGVAVLRGSLAPDGAVIKHTASDPRLLVHRGRAVVFRDYDDLAARIDDPALEVTPDSVLVLKNGGPLGGPGMPEWGQLPIPQKLLAAGVRDMVRVSDARMSGTSYGACVLHVAPESYVGGPLAFVKDGDAIELDVPKRRIDLAVDPWDLARRREAWQPPAPHYRRGYGLLHALHVSQANEGCDFDFLASREPTPEPQIH
jgi:dihydroxy-acid dehydratase